jgi:hypothetical protein
MASDDFDLQEWLRTSCASYEFQPVGTFIAESAQAQWPAQFNADDPDDLVRVLRERGHLQPLPTESAALANVVEVSMTGFLLALAEQVPGLDAVKGTDRGYPDLEFTGEALGQGIWAVDIKVAMRNTKVKRPTTTQSRITLYTGNTYFKYPHLPLPGILRPFDDYAGHLDVVVLYTFGDDEQRVSDVQVAVHKPWRIASRTRSSKTREYIGAVTRLQDIIDGMGAFETEDDFYRYWRKFPFKQSTVVVDVLERLHKQSQSNT